MHRGYIKLWRKVGEWEWFTDVNTCHLFIYLLLHVRNTDGAWRGISLLRGEIIQSIDTLAEGSGLSAQNVRTAIHHLKSTGEVTERQHGKYRILQLKNYSEYHQSNKETNGEVTGNQQDANGEVTAKEKVKKGKKGKKEKKIYNHQTESLNEWIEERCKKLGLDNHVNKNTLDIYVEKYSGTGVKMRVELDGYLAWMVDERKKVLRSTAVGNCFRRAKEYQKTQELKKLKNRKETPGVNQGREFFQKGE